MAVVALHTASTGMNAISTQIDVIANNLANVNTTAFKNQRVNFEDLLYQQKAQPGVETPTATSARPASSWAWAFAWPIPISTSAKAARSRPISRWT